MQPSQTHIVRVALFHETERNLTKLRETEQNLTKPSDNVVKRVTKMYQIAI